MPARRKPKPAPKGKERVEPHFGGGKRAPARKPRKSARRSASASPVRRALLAAFSPRLALIALIIVGGFLYFVARLPDPILLTLDDRPPNLTVLASDGTVLAERGLRRGYVRLDRLPPICPAR
jgi:penicillin-binding protein 1A